MTEIDFEPSERLEDLFLFLRVSYVQRRDVAALCCQTVWMCVRVGPSANLESEENLRKK